MPVRVRQAEEGFTMIVTVIGMTLIAMLVLVSVTAVRGDLHVGRGDLNRKQAYEAAKAGIDDYAFHLHANGNYWGFCAEVPKPNAVNQVGSTENKRPVPGNTGAEYAIELLPAEGQARCDPEHPTTTMIETSGTMKGTFRIRSTGFAGNARVPITATFKTASFLDYVYSTQLETLDPVTFGFTNTGELTNAYTQCSLTRQEGRYSRNIPGTSPAQKCEEIVFGAGDKINGPLHTNDAMAICDTPTFGRNSLDPIEVSAIEEPSKGLRGWYTASGCRATPEFKGKWITSSPPLVPPPTDETLEEQTEPGFRFKGQVHICLNGENMTVASNSACTQGVVYNNGKIPANGLVYVADVPGGTCSGEYSPFKAEYPAASECGNAYVHGTYSGQLTIAAANDIVIDGKTCRGSCSGPTGNGMLGLIANNFVRVFHNYPSEKLPTGLNRDPNCGSSSESKVSDIVIDAAILSLNHSFIVDHYDCGSSLGTLTINGALSQKYRGPVKRGSTGYVKSYNYDERLKYLEPPHFIQPEKLPWVIGRETIG